MTRALATALLLFASCAAADGDGGWDFADGKSDGSGAISYGALGLAQVPPAFDTVKMGLVVIDSDVLPHEAKAVRKQLAELRDKVDLFGYAYSDKNGDPWQDIREQLDVGYETIGAFKDLFDRQGVEDPMDAVYDQAEVEEHRTEVLAWKSEFDQARVATRAYLAAPSQNKLYDRDRKDLSPYFWGATSLEPSLSKSGLKNMAKLTRDLLEKAIDGYDDVLDLREIHKPSNQEPFHAFRKRIRSISRMPGYFAAIVKSSADISEEMTTLTDAVDRYGNLNDLITRYQHDPSGDLKDEIATEWKALRDWQKEVELDKVLDDIRDAIRS